MLANVIFKPPEGGYPGVIVAIGMIVVEVVHAIPADPAAVVLDQTPGNGAMSEIVKLLQHRELCGGARLACQAPQDDGRMVAVMRKKLFELAAEFGQVSGRQIGVPRRILHPGENTVLVREVEELFWRKPQTELHEVETAGTREFQIASPSGFIRLRRQARRIVAPVQHAAHLQRLTVEKKLRASGLDLAEGSADNHFV